MGLEQHSSQQEINMPCGPERQPAIYCGRGNTGGVISSKCYKHSSATSLTKIESQSHSLTHIHTGRCVYSSVCACLYLYSNIYTFLCYFVSCLVGEFYHLGESVILQLIYVTNSEFRVVVSSMQ